MIQKIIKIILLFMIIADGVYAEEPAVSCSQTERENNTLVIAVDKNYPPFTMLNAEGKPAGMFVDLWRLWAEKSGQKIEFRITEWNETLTGLKNGEADIHSGLFRSKERETWLDFSQPFYEAESAVFCSVKNSQINEIKDLSGKKVGAVIGTHQADYLREKYPDINVILLNNNNEIFSAMAKEEITALIEEIIPMRMMTIQMGMQGDFKYLKDTVYSQNIFAAVCKGNTKLLSIIDKGLNQISNKEILEIESRWITDPDIRYYKSYTNTIRLTAEEERWIRNNKIIRTGVGIAWPPFQFMENDEFKGIASDYIRILNERLGLNMEIVKGITWNEVLERAKARKIDIFACATETPERKEYMMFTRNYLSSPLVIITQKDAPFVGGMDDLHGKTLATVKLLATYPKIEKNYPDIIPYFVKTPPEQLEAVSLGKADACIENLAVASYLIQKNNLANLKIAAPAPLPNTDLAFAVRSDWSILADILNKGLDSITQDEHNAIRQKWIAVRYEHGISVKEVLQIIGAAIFILAIVLLWNMQIRQREEHFRGLTEHGLDITQAFTKEGKILYQSPSHTAILGYDPGELVGKSAFDLFHKDDMESWQNILSAILGDGSSPTVLSFVHRFRHKNGHFRYFESNCINLLENKALKAIVINARDITDRKAAEDALNQAHKELESKAAELAEVNKELSQYTYVVSHDLRAPLRAIHNYADFLLEDLADTLEEEPKMYLDGLNRAVREANTLTEDLLVLSRIGRQHFPVERIDVGRFLHEMLNSLEIPSDTEIIIADNLPVIEAEPVLIRQIFQNLIGNGIKFNKSPEKKVEVACRPMEDDKYEFSVKDNGIGIDSRFFQQIFRVFERLHIKEEFEGTGIGLAIVKKTVGKMGGSVRVESEPGKGSTFFIILPKKQQEVRNDKEAVCDSDG